MIILRLLLLLTNLHLKLLSTQGTGTDKLLSTQRVKYFDQILSLKIFQNYHFLYKILKKLQFLYKRINILDTRLLWGNNYSREKNFEKFMIDVFWYIF